MLLSVVPIAIGITLALEQLLVSLTNRSEDALRAKRMDPKAAVFSNGFDLAANPRMLHSLVSTTTL